MAKLKHKRKTSQPKQNVLLKLDLGCGQNKREGFTGVDSVAGAGVDVVHDLMKFPWPFKSDSVEEVFSSHFLEHVPGLLRIPFMDELYRVMKVGAKAIIITPFGWSSRAVQDPTHQWPPIVEASFLYFNKGWREQNKLTHYLGKCDFDFNINYIADPETASKNEESRNFYIKHYVNAISDLQMVLTKRQP